jgi:sugar lactone lactonase YvrE
MGSGFEELPHEMGRQQPKGKMKSRITSAILLIISAGYFCLPVYAQTKISFILPVAGTGSYGYSDGAAASAAIDAVYAIACDAQGNIYFTDSWNNRVRRIGTDRMVTTLAGTGEAGFSGDNGSALDAKLNCPHGIAVDDQGNVYVSDSGNARVRKITPSGIISTIAGTGQVGFSGDDGPAASAQFNFPRGLALHEDGNLYIADSLNFRIRKIDLQGTISTVAGMGAHGNSGDGGLAIEATIGLVQSISIDSAGHIIFADVYNHCVREITPGGNISSISGGGFGSAGDGGPAASAQFRFPHGLVADSQGRIFIADSGNHRIRMIDTNGIVTTVAGTGTAGFSGDGAAATWAQMDYPYAVALDPSGCLLIADLRNYRVRKFDTSFKTFIPSDFDSDGNADIMWRNASTGEALFWLMSGAAKLGVVSLGDIDLNWRILGSADFNGDGKSDLLWRNDATGANCVWYMDGVTHIGGSYLEAVPDLDWNIAAVMDFSGDGKPDIVWRNASSGENYIWYMNGVARNGGLYLETVEDQNWKIVGAGDFNGDGKADILWRNTSTGEIYAWYMNGAVRAGGDYLETVTDQNWQVTGAMDLNGDGSVDILWRNASTGENYVWYMNKTSREAGAFLEPVPDCSWKMSDTGSATPTASPAIGPDFDADGKPDILWRNSSTGQVLIWTMDGVKQKGYNPSVEYVEDQNWRIAGLADFNGDGKVDILWRNYATGENYIWYMNGTVKSGGTYLETSPDLAWKIVGTGDFNGDGKADILWRNTSTGDNYVWCLNGVVRNETVYLDSVTDPSWEIVGTGDFNGDGKVDILWRNASTGVNYIWFMNGVIRLESGIWLDTVADLAWKIVGTGDYNDDGKVDIVWRNTSTGENYAWYMNGYVRAGGSYLPTVPDHAWQMMPQLY